MQQLSEGTNVWGTEIERDGDFLRVPRTVLYFGRYRPDIMGKQLKPRHLQLLLVLAAHKYKTKPIRAYWETVATEMGVKAGTARKWGYELREMKLIKIKQHRGRDPKTGQPGIKNERNTFDISPFIELIQKAHPQRKHDRAKSKKSRSGDTE